MNGNDKNNNSQRQLTIMTNKGTANNDERKNF